MIALLAVASVVPLVLHVRNEFGPQAPSRAVATLAGLSVAPVVAAGIWFLIPFSLVSAPLAPCLFLLGRHVYRPDKIRSNRERAYCLGCVATPPVVWTVFAVLTRVL